MGCCRVFLLICCSLHLQVQRVAAAGVADGPAAVRLRRQGDPGAAETSRSAAADQQEDGGRRSSHLLPVHGPQHSSGAWRDHTPLPWGSPAFWSSFSLWPSQIVKVLTMYTPVIEFEERVSTAFITTIKVSYWSSTLCFAFCQTADCIFPSKF